VVSVVAVVVAVVCVAVVVVVVCVAGDVIVVGEAVLEQARGAVSVECVVDRGVAVEEEAGELVDVAELRAAQSVECTGFQCTR